MTDDADRFGHDDAAYVMGALSEDERRAFEAHLADCPRCTEAVAELSGMTTLLGKVPLARVLEPGGHGDPPPDLLLPRLVRAARTERRRRSLWLVASGAVAASVVAAAIVLGVGVTETGTSTPPAAAGVAMTPVKEAAAVTATLRMTPATWGTRVSLNCRWVGATTGAGAGVKKTYRLVAVPRDGSDPQVLAQWAVLPGEDAIVTGSTNLDPAGIATVELRAVADDSVLLETQNPSS